MKSINYYLISMVLVVFAGLLFLAYSGFFTFPEVEEIETGPYSLVCSEYKGHYEKIPYKIDSICKVLEPEKVNIQKKFTIYYTKPQLKKQQNLFTILGCILEKEDLNKIIELERKGHTIRHIGKTKAMVIRIPNRNRYSIIAARRKIYSSFEKYMLANEYEILPNGQIGIMEIIDKEQLTYIAEIRNLQ